MRPGLFGLPPISIRTRLVTMVAAVAAVGLLVSGSAALVVEQRRLLARVNHSLAQEIAEFSELADSGTDPETGAAFASSERLVTLAMSRNVPDRNETHIGFLRGETLVPYRGPTTLHTDQAFRRAVERHTEPGFGTWQSDVHGHVQYAVMPVVHAAERSHYVVAYFVDLERREMVFAIRVYGLAGVLSWLALVGATWILARRILRPINELQQTAAAISDSDLSRRIAVAGRDEVAALGDTFNAMLDRLAQALRGQRRMLDDAGHELRTPITVIRGHLELMDPDDPADVLETRELAVDELDRMSRMVDDLIILAKAQRPDFLRMTRVDIADLVRRTQAKATGLAPRQWALDQCTASPVQADPERVAQALLQFAANAVSVTTPGDTIAMGCMDTSRGVRLWVRDTGPGVPRERRREVFDRWVTDSSRRTDERAGSGLGLAIVDAIARAHKGTASVTDAVPAGALFLIDLPHADPDKDRHIGISITPEIARIPWRTV